MAQPKTLTGLGVSNLAWPASELDSALGLLTDHGVAGVEVAPTRIAPWDGLVRERLDAYHGRVADRGLTITSLQAIFFGVPEAQLLGDVVAFSRFQDHLQKVADIAVRLGARRLVFGAPANRRCFDQDRTTATALALERLASIGDMLTGRDVTLVLEPVPEAYGGQFLTRAEEVRDLISALGRDNVGLHLDTACAFLAGEDLAGLVATGRTRPEHVHIAEPELGGFASPRCGHAPFARALRRTSYAKWMVIEMREQPDWREALTVAIAFARRTYSKDECTKI